MRTLGWRAGGKVNAEFWNAVCAQNDVAEDIIIEQVAGLLGSGGIDVNMEKHFEHICINWGTVSATFAAITMNRVGVATFLIGQPGVRLDRRYSPHQWTVLHQAVMKGQASVVTAILRRTDVAGLLKAQDDHGRTALHMAAEDARSDIALELLSSGAVVDAPDIDGLTPLHTLIWNAGHSDAGHVLDTAKCLLDYGADPNSQDRFGDRPIHDAARMEIPTNAGDDDKRYLKEKLVKILLEYDADPDTDYVWRLTESWDDDRNEAKDAVRKTLKESTGKRQQTSPSSWVRVPHQAAHDWPMKRRAAAGPSPLGRDPRPDPPNDEGRRGLSGGQEWGLGLRDGGSNPRLLSIVVSDLDYEWPDTDEF
ncbi:hypothetical protein DL769_006864 [Monosporascus sp. CRB-8-3]|nr:hypothetical protein DL769_006864 [Monosporascus sp. CRB-8-3]